MQSTLGALTSVINGTLMQPCVLQTVFVRFAFVSSKRIPNNGTLQQCELYLLSG